MNKKILSFVALVTVATLISSVYAAWSTMVSNPNFSSSANWQVGLWMEGTGSHDYSIENGEATTYLQISGFNDWGNTEYQQGEDPWGSWGSGFTSVPAESTQRLVTNSKTTSVSSHWLYGRMNAYVEFWLTDGTNWAEAMVVFDSDGSWLVPCNAGENGYWANTNPGWYFVGYHHYDVGSSFTYKETNLNSIFGLLESEFDLDLEDWDVVGICVGTEGTSTTATHVWDYVYYDVAM